MPMSLEKIDTADLLGIIRYSPREKTIARERN